MIRRLLTTIALAVLAGCSGNSPTYPSPGGGGSTGDDNGGGTAPPTAAVTVGNIFFKSGHNGSAGPAVDTVAAGGTVTWTWNAGNVPHSVRSLGSPAFTSSAVQTGDGSTHQIVFSTPGTYQYDCAVHGTMMMGTIVVQ